jgi:glycosyltransferase involved in cell wall biosynthesis
LTVLYVGRLIAIKRVSDLIEAFGELDDPAHANWRLRIIGDGSERSQLELQALRDSRVTFEGFKSYDELGTIFGQCDVLVLPSEQEPWGLVVNEALGYGLYVVTSDRVGSAFDMLDSGTGTTYPVGDTAALMAALRRSAEFPTRRPQACRSDTAALMAASLREVPGATY